MDINRFLQTFEQQAEETPDQPAAVFGEDALSYDQLRRKSNQLAAFLLKAGAGREQPIPISLNRSLELMVGVLGVLKSGAPYVPLDPAYPVDRLSLMLQDSGASRVLTHSSLRNRFEEQGVEVICIDEVAGALAELPDEDPRVTIAPEDLAYIIFTSGSTGRPKGVSLPHRALDNLIEWQIHRPRFAPQARVLQFASLSFDVSFQEIFSTWCSGGTLYLIDENLRRDPGRLLDLIEKNRIRRLYLPFVALRQIAESAVQISTCPASLKEVYTAGEQLFVTREIRAFFRHLPEAILENQYGPSESHVVSALTLNSDPRNWPDSPSIGYPLPNTQLLVVKEDLSPANDGEQGELYISGVCLARGYFGRQDLTEQRFIHLPLAEGTAVRAYKTGDLVTRNPDGEIFFKGRADHQVKIRGHRVEPGEVAAVLSKSPDVSQCHVVAREIQPGIKSLVAYFRMPAYSKESEQRFREFAGAQLPDYMAPSVFTRVEEFPLTPSGKVDVKALPAPKLDDLIQRDFTPPETEAEKKLARIWSEVLKFPEISVTANFFDLGGHSLLVGGMFEKIRREFGKDLPFSALIESPTIRQMANLLDSNIDFSSSLQCLVPIQPNGHRIPFFCIHGGLGNVVNFSLIANALGPEQPFFGLQWRGVDGRRGQTSFDRMVSDYMEEIRAVCPHGPYVLGGLCSGGIIAYEMARRFKAMGEEIPLVVMYDSPNLWTDHYCPTGTPPRQRTATNDQSANTAAAQNADPAAPAARNQKPTRGKRFLDKVFRKIREIIGIQGRLLLGMKVAPEFREKYAALTMVHAIRRHQIKPYDGPVLFIRSSSVRRGSEIALTGYWKDDILGWAPVKTENFEVRHVASSHQKIMIKPASLKILEDALNRIQSQSNRRAPEVAAA